MFGAPLTLLRLEAAAALTGASLLTPRWAADGPCSPCSFFSPTLSMLGYLAGRRVGAACYNRAHSYLGPAVLAALGAASNAHGFFFVAGIWAAHVGFDRVLGYGLKYGTSFGDTHLGRRGGGQSR